MKIVFFGTPSFSVPILEHLAREYDIALVVSQKDAYVGRKRILTSSPVKKLAKKLNIPVFTPEKIKEDYAPILECQPDIIITAAYGQIIPQIILDCPRLGCINVHASLLPKLRGGAPIHHAIIDGEKETGITIMYMAPKMDDGDIITQEKITIEDDDTYGSLNDKLSILGTNLLMETLPSIINGNNQRIKQDETKVTFGLNIKREEEKIDFKKTTREIYNQIRGLNPAPSAYINLNGVETKVLESTINLNEVLGNVGCISNIYKDGIGIKTIDGEIILKKIKPFSKKEMDVKTYLNGINKDNLKGMNVNG